MFFFYGSKPDGSKPIFSFVQGVDGLFITIPSENVVAAIKECQALNVPVISVNTGAELAVELGLVHHISQLEYSAVSSLVPFFIYFPYSFAFLSHHIIARCASKTILFLSNNLFFSARDLVPERG